MHDDYPRRPRDLWNPPLRREYGRIALHPDDPRYESIEPAMVRVGRCFGVIYDELIGSLRYELTKRADRPTPVFPFVYDWRQPIRASATALGEFLGEVLARTRLLRHYKSNREHLRVDLVAHSMGALVLCEYLSHNGAGARIGKVATIGAPFLGTVEALAMILTGSGNLAGPTPAENEREAARIMPAAYHMLPSYQGAVRGPASAITDLFKVDAWQKGVLESLTEYVRLHSVDAGTVAANKTKAKMILGELLRDAWEHRERVTNLRLESTGTTPDDWLVIVGIGGRTRLATEVTLVKGEPRYSVGDELFRDYWRDNPQSRETGDETVPLLGALPPFLDEGHVVAVTPRDFGFWELRDRFAAHVVSFHALLPTMNLVQRLVLRHLRSDYHGAVWGRSIPGVKPRQWHPPFSIRPKDPAPCNADRGRSPSDNWGWPSDPDRTDV